MWILEERTLKAFPFRGPSAQRALAQIRRLWDAEPGTDARNMLEVLAMLAHHYERTREPLPDLDPIDAIKFRMEQQGLSRRDLLPIFGSTGRISEVFSGKRPLNLEMIRKLHVTLDIPLEALIQTRRIRSRSPRRKPIAKRARTTRSPSQKRAS